MINLKTCSVIGCTIVWRTERLDTSLATDLTGLQAYALCGQQMAPFVFSNGGKLLYSGSAAFTMLGEVEQLWDAVAIMEYPSKEAFVEIVAQPEVHKFAVHREAGLEGQLLIATSQNA